MSSELGTSMMMKSCPGSCSSHQSRPSGSRAFRALLLPHLRQCLRLVAKVDDLLLHIGRFGEDLLQLSLSFQRSQPPLLSSATWWLAPSARNRLKASPWSTGDDALGDSGMSAEKKFFLHHSPQRFKLCDTEAHITRAHADKDKAEGDKHAEHVDKHGTRKNK